MSITLFRFKPSARFDSWRALARKLSNKFITQLKKVTTRATFSPSPVPSPSLRALKEFEIRCCTVVLGLPQCQGTPNSPTPPKQQPGFDKLTARLKKLEESMAGEDQVATEKQIRQTKRLVKTLPLLLAKQLQQRGIGRREATTTAKQLYQKALLDALNANGWTLINNEICYGETNYRSSQLPASAMCRKGTNIFENRYEQGKGIACRATKEQHAPNLWISEFSRDPKASGDPKKVLFRGVRHGVLSAYGLKKGSEERRHAAVERAREVVTAALFASGQLEAALAKPEEAVALKLSSTSLVTAFDAGKFQEGAQLKDQLAAWQQLCQGEQPLSLKVYDGNGKLQQIKVNLQVAAFNFGVNEAALKLGVGWQQSDRANDQALRQLLGDPKGEIGGWVSEYLANSPPPANATIVEQLAQQIRSIWNNRDHHGDGGEPYKMVQRILLLSHAIGVVPCWNCKSGKDRTGMADAETKYGAILLDQKGELPEPGQVLTEDQRSLLGKVLANSGNLEIQKLNTGAAGNLVIKQTRPFPLHWFKLSYDRRLSGESLKQTRGLAGVVNS